MRLSPPRSPSSVGDRGEPRRPSLRLLGSIAAIAILAAACVAPAATSSPTTVPSGGVSQAATATAPPVQPARVTPAQSASATPSAPAMVPPVIVTFLVGQQASFSVRLVTAEQIDQAERLERDGGGPQIPVGTIVRSASSDNPGYPWHLDPTTFTFENQPSPSCEGLPSDIDRGSLATATTYCPTDTTVIRIEPAA